MNEAKKLNMAVTMALWIVMGTLFMILMLKTAFEKTIVIADTANEEELLQEQGLLKPEENAQSQAFALLLQNRLIAEGAADTNGGRNCFQIPLPANVKAEAVVAENRYMDKELWLYVQGGTTEFYKDILMYGDESLVEDGFCRSTKDGIVLELHMKQVLEYRSTMEESMLYIEAFQPRELYQEIVVIDPIGGGAETGIVHGGLEEKELALQVAKLLKKKELSPEVKLYFTRMEDKAVTEEERLALIEAVDADLYLQLSACENTENTDVYGIQSFYNEEYYIPQFGNVEWADVVTRNVTLTAKNRAVGLGAASQESILEKIEVPAAKLCMGYMSNATECALLKQEAYREKLADGIAAALMEVYSGKEALK